MIVAAGSADDWNFEAIKAWFRNDMRYLEWDIVGEIYAGGFMTAEDIEKSNYPQQAYELGKQV